jgi:8-oxo-dGTP diphosphatase
LIFLIRHASAGDRDEWVGDDRRRPLDERGRLQSAELVELLAGYEFDRLLSSPAVRCVQTVEPLAAARGLEIEICEELSEELQHDAGVDLVRSLMDTQTACSCHGGLSDAVCGESQKKGEVLVLDELRPVERLRAKGKTKRA